MKSNPAAIILFDRCHFTRRILSSAMILFLLSVMGMGGVYSSRRTVTFRADKIVSKALNRHVPSDHFAEWFSRDETPLLVLSSNPGIDNITKISENAYRARVAPLKFPGLTVISTVDLNVEFDYSRFAAHCKEGGFSQEFEGNKLFAKIVSKLIPSVISSNICSFDEESCILSNQAKLEISFELPSWFPINADMIEKRGSETIAKNIETDTTVLLDKIIAAYLVDSRGEDLHSTLQ